MDGCHASTCFVHALAVTPGCRAPAQAMLSHIAKFSATTRLCNASKTAIKASKSRKIAARASLSFGRSLAAQSNSYTHPLSKTTYTQKISYVKTVVRRHAGCGMPHDGDENPGVGMERELRAHMNVTNLIIEDTSGNGSFFYVEVESPDFEGKSKLQCHRMVQDIVSKQIENIHGLRIKTSTPPKTA